MILPGEGGSVVTHCHANPDRVWDIRASMKEANHPSAAPQRTTCLVRRRVNKRTARLMARMIPVRIRAEA